MDWFATCSQASQIHSTQERIKVTLVTPNTHFFWNVAATRGIIPGEFSEEQLFLPIESGFEKYSETSFEFVLGRAKRIDGAENRVLVGMNDGTQRDISYSKLVIATGSRPSSDLPLKPLGTHEETVTSWRALQNRIGKSKNIVVAGSGPTGIEVAGELAAKYGAGRSITIIMSGNKPLENYKNLLPSVVNTIENDLTKLGVKLIRGKRVVDSVEVGEQAKLTLSDGTELTADCYLPLFGLKTNNSFVPLEWLDNDGNVSVDGHMRVVKTDNVWAIGDIGSIEPKQITVSDNQIIYLAATLDGILTGSQLGKEYVPEKKTMMFLSLGKSYATGQIGSWKLFGFLVSWVKGRRLFTDTAEGYVQGKQLRHSNL